jgi:hypothetical protein
MEQEAQQGATAVNCDQTRQYALEYLDGELDETLTVAIRIHIEMCKPCGRRITFEAAFLKSLSRCRSSNRLPQSVEERCRIIMQEWRKGEA